MTKINNLILIFTLAMVGFSSAIAANDWAEVPANITIEEFLDAHFSREMKGGSVMTVAFYPSDEPHSAFVMVMQTRRDDLVTKRNLRREIREDGELLYELFKTMIRHPKVKKRWKLVPTNENFIIRHLRSGSHVTLAVTVDGKTYFDDETFKRVAILVKHRGGVWLD